MKIIIKENKVVNLIDTIIKRNYPNFRKGISVEDISISNAGTEMISYTDPDDDIVFATFILKKKKIILKYGIYETLENTLGQDLVDYFIAWFNNEFNTNAQRLSI